MPQIIPIRDLRNTTELSALCHKQTEPVFVTKNGYGDLVVMSIETYDRMRGAALTDAAIASAEAEMAAGAAPLEAESALFALRRKHLG